VLAGSLGLLAALFAAAAQAWYLPNEPGGLWNEAALAVLALLAAGCLYAALRATALGPTPLLLPALWAGCYGLAGAAEIQVARDGVTLGEPRSYLYAPADCGFALRLPARPAENRQALLVAPGRATEIRMAALSDLTTASAYRIECVALSEGVAADALIALARERIEDWARQGKLEIDSIERIEGAHPELRITARKQGRDLENRERETRVAARVAIGSRAMITLLATRMDGQAPDEAVLRSLAPRAD